MFNKQTKKRASKKPAKLKYKRNLFGLAMAYTVSAMVGAVGVAGWLLSGSGIGPLAFAGLAAGAAFIIPICAGLVARGAFGWVALAPALVFAGWSAYSIENANRVIVEAPHVAAYEASQAPAKAAAAAAAARLEALQDKRANFTPEVVNCDPCKNTKLDAERRDAARKADLDALIVTAKADLAGKQAAVSAYVPLVDWRFVLAFGALVDLVLALLVYSLEKVAESNRRLAEQAKAKQEQAQRRQPAAQRKASAAKVAPVVAATVDPLAILSPAERRALLRVV
jgi:Na+-transporting methylmalonyl-CoA/oxaloacetate decarboxylase gamma subunit